MVIIILEEHQMTVLTIIGILAALVLIFVIIEHVNRYSVKHYRYEFFTWASLVVTSIGYALIFFGHNWYVDALSKSGDILNGQILMGIGAVTVLFMLVTHIRRTSILFGTFFGVFQLILYVPASVISFLAVIVLIAWAAETKPVYNIN